jgi:hypothetical protein
MFLPSDAFGLDIASMVALVGDCRDRECTIGDSEIISGLRVIAERSGRAMSHVGYFDVNDRHSTRRTTARS